MGRRTVRFVGEKRGHLEVVSILPQNKSGRHVQLELLCHACKGRTTQSSVVFGKSKSCGCERHKPGAGKTMGPKAMPWQLPEGEAAKRLLIGRYRGSARRRNIPFDLSDQELITLFKGSCYYCGQSETSVCKGLGKTSGNYSYVGIDRKNSNLGYTRENTVSCCWTCNMMKNNLTEGFFLEHISKVFNHKGLHKDE